MQCYILQCLDLWYRTPKKTVDSIKNRIDSSGWKIKRRMMRFAKFWEAVCEKLEGDGPAMAPPQPLIITLQLLQITEVPTQDQSPPSCHTEERKNYYILSCYCFFFYLGKGRQNQNVNFFQKGHWGDDPKVNFFDFFNAVKIGFKMGFFDTQISSS